ncbi:hypothetical protein KKG81_00255 [bacterium]|nr:hypothetical protein [bacterium]
MKEKDDMVWIIFIFMVFVGLVYLLVWGFHNDSLKAIALSTIYMVVLIFSILGRRERRKLLNNLINQIKNIMIGIKRIFRLFI